MVKRTVVARMIRVRLPARTPNRKESENAEDMSMLSQLGRGVSVL